MRAGIAGRSWPLGLALLAFCAIAYGPALHVPFIGDDYVFLDKTRSASFAELWSRTNTDFGWYRPWSRELHFWVLQKVIGASEPGFRAASLALWLAGLGLYFGFLRRCAGPRVSVLATLGVCSLSLWGAPLIWISGAQDLWMLFFVCLTLLLVDRSERGWAMLAYCAALLSKETAATTPLIVLAHSRWIRRDSWSASARAVGPFLALTAGWLLFHPTLLARLAHPGQFTIGAEQPAPPQVALTFSILTLFNVDKLSVPTDFEALRPVAALGSAAVLVLAAALLVSSDNRGSEVGASRASSEDLARFGAAWCLAAWLPLLQSSIGWHAYYGSLGVLGAWLVIAERLARRSRRLLLPVILVLGLLRGWAAAARSWDWGSEWYQTRAGDMLAVIRTQLLALHPALPPNSRLYFGNIPNNIGLIAGQSPAIRVWYGDPSLSAGFYSYYRPRTPGDARGRDFFFHFDSTTGIREVFADGGSPSAVGGDRTWEGDHERLAVTFLTSGDLPGAARLFEAIAKLPNRPDALMFAAVCWRESGDSLRAGVDLAQARERMQLSPAQAADWELRLRQSMPRTTAR